MINKNLGRLQKVALREAWGSEAGDFTPWLAHEDNLKLLGDAIGIELELESQKKKWVHFGLTYFVKTSPLTIGF